MLTCPPAPHSTAAGLDPKGGPEVTVYPNRKPNRCNKLALR
jgi:hypothetical protein